MQTRLTRLGRIGINCCVNHKCALRQLQTASAVKDHRGEKAKLVPPSVPKYEQFSSSIAAGNVEHAEGLLRSFLEQKPSLITTPVFNTLIRAWIQKRSIKRAFKIYDLLQETRSPNAKTITALINAALIHKQELHRLPELMEALHDYKITPIRLLSSQQHKTRQEDQTKVDPKVSVKLSPSQGDLIDPYERQLRKEMNDLDEQVQFYKSLSKGITKDNYNCSRGSRKNTSSKQSSELKDSHVLILRWFQSLSKSIEKERELLKEFRPDKEISEDLNASEVIEMIQNEETQSKMLYHLNEFAADKLALLTIRETLVQLISNPTGARFTNVVIAIGSALESQLHYQQVYAVVRGMRARSLDTSEQFIKAKEQVNKKENWPPAFIATIGGWLVNLLLHSTTLLNGKTLPFRHSYQNRDGKRYGMVLMHSDVYKVMSAEEILKYNTKYYPMVVPPRPWQGVRNGAYYLSSPHIVRSPSESQLRKLKSSKLSTIFSLIDVLSSVPWRINARIFDVVNTCYSEKLPIPGFPCMEAMNDDKSQKTLQYNFMKVFHTAKRFLSEPRIYFPHNMDFRGRCYPIPSYLNHMGPDICRGLLRFGNGELLGDNGLRWMKIHLANLFGKNKLSFDERVAFVDEHMEDVLDTARDPLHGRAWWKQAEAPWQSLAVCMELAAAVQMKDPSGFVSYIPHHADGSCNGLQHYAAIGGDIEGGASVNILPSDLPQDVYSRVLEQVNAKLEEESTLENSPAQYILKKLTRKTIKQTVMTFVYGVTVQGARRQIRIQLEQLKLPHDKLFEVSDYLTRITFHTMENMFISARETMKWLSDCARQVGRIGQPISWTTPFGFPVEQPYRRPGKYKIKTSLQQIVLASEDSEDFPVLAQKQKAAFPPNFIHSLDSTHMLMTAGKCHRVGVTFAAVHDSFWTHAGSMERMNKILRESFIDLHKKPILLELHDQLQQQYPKLRFRSHPESGKLRLDLVQESQYFFH